MVLPLTLTYASLFTMSKTLRDTAADGDGDGDEDGFGTTEALMEDEDGTRVILLAESVVDTPNRKPALPFTLVNALPIVEPFLRNSMSA